MGLYRYAWVSGSARDKDFSALKSRASEVRYYGTGHERTTHEISSSIAQLSTVFDRERDLLVLTGPVLIVWLVSVMLLACGTYHVAIYKEGTYSVETWDGGERVG